LAVAYERGTPVLLGLGRYATPLAERGERERVRRERKRGRETKRGRERERATERERKCVCV